MSDFFDDEEDLNQKEFEDAFERNYFTEDEEDDSLTAYREIFTKTEDERFEEEYKEKALKTEPLILNTHITERVYRLDWSLNKQVVKFQIGDLVIAKNKERIYKIMEFGKDVDTYVTRLSNTEANTTFKGTQLKKAPKESVWERLIVDPYKRWLKEQEEKKKRK